MITAYEERNQQLYDARGALAEAVAELTTELHHRRGEVAQLTAQLEAVSRNAAKLENALRESSELITVLRNMKVVRWTAWPRRLVYRLQSRRP
jgi:ABC-type transporter Mla subunit MlaD